MIVALLVLAAQATAPTAQQTPAPTAVKTALHAPALPAADTVVCRMDATNGQRITRKVCRTAAEWDALERGAKDYLWDRREKASLRGY